MSVGAGSNPVGTAKWSISLMEKCQLVTLMSRVRFSYRPQLIIQWCNGSTTGFGPVSRGSNPC